jgi:hypothetical protein
MKLGLQVVAVAVVLATVGAAGMAADDANPTGTWKWSIDRNGTKIETTLMLKLDGDKLTGSITGRDGKPADIEEASWSKDSGEVKFSISRERNGNKTTTKYTGKVSGDTITGTAATGDRSRDWKADRSK